MIRLVFLAIVLMIAPFWLHAEENSSSRVYVASCVAMEPWESATPRISAYCRRRAPVCLGSSVFPSCLRLCGVGTAQIGLRTAGMGYRLLG